MNWKENWEEAERMEQRRKEKRKVSESKMSLDEKIARMNKDYAIKTSNLDRHFVSKSEKRRMRTLTRKQKIKRRRRLEKLGISLEDQLDDED